jgi:hypothetical protein
MRKSPPLQFSMHSLVTFVGSIAVLFGVMRYVREARWPIVVAFFVALASVAVCRKRRLVAAVLSASLGSGITAIFVLWHFHHSSQRGAYLVMQLERQKPPAYAGELVFQHFVFGAALGVIVWGVLWILEKCIRDRLNLLRCWSGASNPKPSNKSADDQI